MKERIKAEFCTHAWKQSQFQMLTDDATTSYICIKCGKHSQFQEDVMKIGDKVKIRVISASKLLRQIDFEIIEK